MRKILNILFLCVVFAGFTSGKKESEPGISWNHLTDKDYVVRYVTVVYDTASKVTSYNVDDHAPVFPKSNVRLLQAFISDTSNFSNDFEGNYTPSDITHVIVVTRREELEGIIELNAGKELWSFDPLSKGMEAAVLSDKGRLMKNKLFEWLKK